MQHRILLVDDEPNFISGLKRSLRNEKYEILSANSAEQALDILDRDRDNVDIVISDQDMPGMRGTEFLKTVRQKFPEIVRFILTGKASLEVAIDAINNGEISRFFTKPCNTIDLAITIRQALEQKDLVTKSKSLLKKVQHQSAILQQLEKENPGITKIERDEQGAVVIEDAPMEIDKLLEKIDEHIPKKENRLS